MEITKENLEELRKDPLMRIIANLFVTDLDELVDNAEKELAEAEKEEKSKFEKTQEEKVTAQTFDELAGKIGEALRATKVERVNSNETKESVKKPYEAPNAEVRTFVMSKEQFVEFTKLYTELINAESKLSYLYGISFENMGSQFNFANSVSKIIWNFVRIIFGDENADDIADFLYGNSNFDSAEQLYEELV